MKKSMISAIAAICILVVSATLFSGIVPVKYDIKVGDTAPHDIYATREVIDAVTTEKLRKQAEEAVGQQYVQNNDVTLRADRDLANIFLEISKSRQGEASAFRSNYCLGLSSEEYKTFRETLTELQQEIMNKGVINVDEALSQARESLRTKTYNEQAAAAGVEILKETIAVNRERSDEKTQEEIKRARAAVSDVVYKENQVIVRKGDLVNEAQFSVLSSLGLVKGKGSIKVFQFLGTVLFTLGIFAVICIYLRSIKGRENMPKNFPLLISIIATACVLLTYINKGKFINAYMIPVAAGGILLSILLGTRVAIFMHTVITLVCAIAMGENAYYIASVLIAGYISIFFFVSTSHRSKLVIASCWCTGVTVVTFLVIAMLQGVGLSESFAKCGYGIINAVLSSIIVMGVLPFLETFFDVVTPFRLLELSNPDNPLLSRLLKEAPGTYHHSLMVGNLAEAAAEAIKGDSLLARVGAYYHDAGKLAQPEMYTENQYGVNPHDNLTCYESAKTIITHVKEGILLQRQYKIPGAIRQITACHHGNTPVAYFLYKAQKAGEFVNENDFRYPGPLPKTKEETVVMLSDSVEAAVRSLDDKSEKAIREMINKIITGKMNDGQLSACPLTFAEIEKITEAFMKVFDGYFHSRIKYPEKNSEEVKNDN